MHWSFRTLEDRAISKHFSAKKQHYDSSIHQGDMSVHSCDLNSQRHVPVSQVFPPWRTTLSEKCSMVHYVSFFFYCVIEVVKGRWCLAPLCIYLSALVQFVQLLICSMISKTLLCGIAVTDGDIPSTKSLYFCCRKMCLSRSLSPISNIFQNISRFEVQMH